jgi:DNA-binding transcriptional LysR family regulator
MTLKQIEAFYWAAKLGSFAIAAERLHVTQSSLSKRIAELEESIGASLFDRSNKRAQLSDAGQRLIGLAAKMLELSVTMRSEANASFGLRGVCRFGITELGSLTWLPGFIGLARQLYPALVFQPHVGLARILERLVSRGELDFAVAPGHAQDEEISSKKVGEIECTWMASTSRISAGTVLSARELEKLPIITMTEGSGLTSVLSQWALEHGINLHKAMASNSMMAIVGLTAADVGISYLPVVLMESWMTQKKLAAFHSRPSPPNLSYYFLSRADDKRELIEKMEKLISIVPDFTEQMQLSDPERDAQNNDM